MKLTGDALERACGVGVSTFELHKAAQSLERCEELNAFDKHVELAGDDVQGHALIRDQDVVWDVLVDQVVQHDACCVRQSVECVFQVWLLTITSCVDVRRQDDGLEWPVCQLSEPDRAIIHVDLFSVPMFQFRLEKQLFGCQLNRKDLRALLQDPVVALVCVQQVEVQIVNNAVSTHGVVAKTQAWLVAQLENLQYKHENLV